MVFKRLFYSLALFSAACFQIGAMEDPFIKQVQVLDYEESRDLPAIEAIFQSNWDQLVMNKPYDPTFAQQCMQPWAQSNGYKELKVLRYNDKTIGWATVFFQDDPDSPGKKMGGFETGGIASEYRKKGLAKYFLGKAIEDLRTRGAIRINLGVKKTNLIAFDLYQKLGFEIIEEGKIGYRLVKRFQ